MKKNDFILLGAVAILSIFLFIGYRLFFYHPGDYITITVDGEIYKTLPLAETASLDIPGVQGGTNHLEIADGTASITDADCPDKLCVHQKAIRSNGESLICLPHKVIIEVSSRKGAELDGMAN